MRYVALPESLTQEVLVQGAAAAVLLVGVLVVVVRADAAAGPRRPDDHLTLHLGLLMGRKQ